MLTTANYPDVELPAYGMNQAYTLFFVGYQIGGLYFLKSLMLATFYSNYMAQVEEKFQRYERKREKYLVKTFKRFRKRRAGRLQYKECKLLLNMLAMASKSGR